jgi:hypothetical protein
VKRSYKLFTDGSVVERNSTFPNHPMWTFKIIIRVQTGAATLLVEKSMITGGTLSKKKQTSEHRWDTTKNKRRSDGTVQPTGQYTNGRKDKVKDQPHGPTHSGIDSAKKREKSKRFEH